MGLELKSDEEALLFEVALEESGDARDSKTARESICSCYLRKCRFRKKGSEEEGTLTTT